VEKPHVRRFSPSLIVSLVALFVALGGTASAAFLITGRNVKDKSLTGRDIKNGSIFAREIHRGVLTGRQVHNHSLTPKDFRGSVRGPAGPPGTARAFGYVAANGTLNPFISRNIVRLSHPAKGLYCFYLGFQPLNAVASLSSGGSAGVDAVKTTVAHDDAHGDRCAGVEQASVETLNVNLHSNTNSAANGAFYVIFN
jgi:hypothetical protein